MPATSFTIGSIVHARGRDWVVVPGSTDPDILLLRPLGGTDDDITGVSRSIEHVTSATFPHPDPADFGDTVSAAILRDAVRLNIRNGAGPFRSFGRIAVEPRPYQLVPLLMALRLNPVRLMIADDVGIGKTIEAGLIARELLDRGEIRHLAVICPAALCDQWQAELKAKFAIDAVVVRPGTIRKLESPLGADESVFEAYPFVVVSIDYIKNQRRRDQFLTTCPEFVIVDEAHTCSASGRPGSAQQQRHELLQQLVNGVSKRSQNRHLILTTATPHSGNEDAFGSLLSLLDPDFRQLVGRDDLADTDPLGERLRNHLVQRRRDDLRDYVNEETAFPQRIVQEFYWCMSPEARAFFDHVMTFARSQIERASTMARHQQRVSWWAVLALLRASISSPAAAIAALQTRALGLTRQDGHLVVTDDLDAINELGERAVFDIDTDDATEFDDIVPGADATDLSPRDRDRRTLRDLITQAHALTGPNDPKLKRLTSIIQTLRDDGFRPIIFCRYVTTAEYVAEHLSGAFPGVEISAVTGLLPPEERKQRVADLSEHPDRILVATDCLSEGINLQQHFDAVVHYDLAWNPTRHEQRAGRVDRFGQDRPEIRTIMLWGADNVVDRAVMDVLLRKAETIRARLGVAISVPQRSGLIMDSVFDRIFGAGPIQLALQMDGTDADSPIPAEQEAALDREWAVLEHRSSNTIFRQNEIKPETVRSELDEQRAALGTTDAVSGFVRAIARRLGAPLTDQNGRTLMTLSAMPPRVAALFPDHKANTPLHVDFTFPVADGAYHLSRTSEVVEALTSIAIDGALDPRQSPRPARRTGAMLTRAVRSATTLAVARLRIHLRTASHADTREMLAEESLLVAWQRDADGQLRALPDDEVTALLSAEPAANMTDGHRSRVLSRELADDAVTAWTPLITAAAEHRAAALKDAHTRVRDVADPQTSEPGIEATLQTPVDILGLYIYLPAPETHA